MKLITMAVVTWTYHTGCQGKKDKKIVNFLIGGKGDSFTSTLLHTVLLEKKKWIVRQAIFVNFFEG